MTSMDDLHTYNNMAKNDDPSARTQLAALLVSFYMVLLAFFIILNSEARVDQDKQQQVVSSVNSAFNTTQADAAMLVSFEEATNANLVDDLFTELDKLLKKLRENDQVSITTTDMLYRITLPAELIFSHDGKLIQASHEALLQQLVQLLLTHQDGLHLELRMILGDRITQNAPTALDTATRITAADSWARYVGALADMRTHKTQALPIHIAVGLDDALQDQLHYVITASPESITFVPDFTPQDADRGEDDE